MNATLAGTITAVMANFSDLKGQIEAGALRPIAVPAKKRTEALPNVPTLAENGFNDLDAAVWFGFVAPAKTPKETLAQLSQYIADAVKAEGVADRLKGQGMYINVFCGMEFGKSCPIRKTNTQNSHASSISSRNNTTIRQTRGSASVVVLF